MSIVLALTLTLALLTVVCPPAVVARLLYADALLAGCPRRMAGRGRPVGGQR